VILVTFMRRPSADSRLILEVAEEPKPGQVRVLPDFGGNTQLLHLAGSITAAEIRIAQEGYRNARLETVAAQDGNRAGGADMAARALRKHVGPAEARASHRPRPSLRDAARGRTTGEPAPPSGFGPV
jgi:hypothetical protein